MKKILLLFILFSYTLSAQNYDKQWKNVVELEFEGKIKSAMKQTDKIYKKAIKDNNEDQIIKSLLYSSKFLLIVDKDARLKIIQNLENEISRAGVPTKAVLNLIYAESLNSFLQNNSQAFYNRSTTDSTSANFNTWSYSQMLEKIDQLSLESIQNESVLKKIPLKNYDAIFEYDANDAQYSLYEFLVVKRIDHLRSTVYYLNLGKANASQLYANSNDFTATPIVLNEKPVDEILRLYQKLEEFNPAVRHILKRLQFIYSQEANAELYIKALHRLKDKTKTAQNLQKVLVELGLTYKSLASKDQFPDYAKEALNYFNKALPLDTLSSSYAAAHNAREEILQKQLTVKILPIVYPGQIHPARINAKNIGRVEVSFYKVNASDYDIINQHYIKDSVFLATLKSKIPVLQKSYTIPNKQNYLFYSSDIVMPALDEGLYLAKFTIPETDITLMSPLSVTNIGVLSNQIDNKTHYTTVNRKTGKPLPFVKIKTSDFELKTDVTGKAFFGHWKKNNYYNKQQFFNGSDTLTIGNTYITPFRHIDSMGQINATVYLDRAIYRPGQKVFYKLVAAKDQFGHLSVASNVNFTITIDDAESEEILSFDVTTNDFGSFSGEFDLPTQGLTGQYSIRVKESLDPTDGFWNENNIYSSYNSFSVEEYKRPKFKATFKPLKGSHTLNQTIKVSAVAESFSGSAVANAKVKYNIVRKDFPHSYKSYPTEEQNISSGETTTDASGNFDITFNATPNTLLPKSDLPKFIFSVEAIVTDSNGETQIATHNITLAYHSLVLNILAPELVDASKNATADILSTDMNGNFLASDTEVQIIKIHPEQNKFDERTFGQPDIETLSQTEFERLFPNEPYLENPPRELDSIIYVTKINTKDTRTLSLNFLKNHAAGVYKIKASSTDSLGNSIKNERLFTLLQSDSKKIPINQILTIREVKNSVPSDYRTVEILSPIDELHVSYIISFDGQQISLGELELKNKRGLLQIPNNDAYKGTLDINFETVYNNNYYNKGHSLETLDTTKILDFEIESFRSTIEPGTAEKWSFKIQNAPQQMEVLASMYDMSLDQFVQKNWNANLSIDRSSTFLTRSWLNSYSKNIYGAGMLNKITVNHNSTPNLLSFGFDFGKNTYLSRQALAEYRRQLTSKAVKPLGSRVISGIVSDATGPIPFANVVIKGTVRGTQTNYKGFYSIEAAQGEKLEFSFIGYENQILTVGAGTIVNATLNNSDVMLSEVIVTGALSREVSDNQIYNSAGVELLRGRVSGVNSSQQIVLRGNKPETGGEALIIIDNEISDSATLMTMSPEKIASTTILKGSQAVALYGSAAADGVIIVVTTAAIQALTQVSARTNLSETAFFYPHLKASADGRIHFEFTTPEALTQWKLRLLGHDKSARFAYKELTTITKKELMVMPNFPRFFREHDTIIISAKITNMTTSAKTGIASLLFTDPATGKSIEILANNPSIKNFTIAPSANTEINWKVIIPESTEFIQYKIVAKAGKYSDGEESVVPVVSNKLMINEAIPLWVREHSEKEFRFDNLANPSPTLQNYKLTFEYATNPVWIALRSLPYLIEFEHECSEQTFARYYATIMAAHIMKENPNISDVLNAWNITEDNKTNVISDLKGSPWNNKIKSDAELKKDLAQYFDAEYMRKTSVANIRKLKNMQNESGAFPWFNGGPDNVFITSHIVAGLGQIAPLTVDDDYLEILKEAIGYLDENLTNSGKLSTHVFQYCNQCLSLHNIYARSYHLKNFPASKTLLATMNNQLNIIENDWLSLTNYEKATLAIVLNRFGRKASAELILNSFKETVASTENLGMYWIHSNSGYHWHQSPIETHVMIMRAFREITPNDKSISAMTIWLVKQKQNRHWPTTKSTTEAIYELVQNPAWLSIHDKTSIVIGEKKISREQLTESKPEALTGYINLTWNAAEITKDMATITIKNNSDVPAFGGMYWQYLDDINNIEATAANPLSVKKQLWLKSNNDGGIQLKSITTKTALEVGNIVTIRLTIESREDIDFIHLQDMRASCFEPVDVLSGHKTQSNLNFYMSTKDEATHFFFDQIKRGTYVIEYDVKVNNAGDFSNGITTIQSMYAPEFASHTKGIRVNVNAK